MISLRRIVFATFGFVVVWNGGVAKGADADTNVSPVPPPQPMALVGALIRTQSDVGDFVGTVVIKDGKIVAVGRDVRVPPDTQIINLTNHVITPGLIDARSVLWLHGPGARESGNNGGLNILDAVDPFAEDWREAARQGVTAVYVQPGSGGSLGGSGAILRVGPTKSVEDLVIRSPAGIQTALGVSTPVAAQQDNRLAELMARFGIQQPPPQASPTPTASNSITRFAQYEALRRLFEDAKKYGDSKPATRDIGKDLLLVALKREIPVRLECSHEDDIRNVLNLPKDLGVQLIFDRLDRIQHLPEDLALRKDAIVIGPVLSGKRSAEIRKLALDGRKFAIATQTEEARGTAWLRAHASAAVSDGYPRERLLRAMTRDAAEMHGVADKLGSLVAGRAADLVVFAGDPLDPSVPVRMTISQGVVTYEAHQIETVPQVVVDKPNLPDPMPASYVIKTNRLLNEAGDLVPGELFIEQDKIASLAARNSAAPVFDVGNAVVTPGLVAAQVIVNGEAMPDADAGQLNGADGLAPDDGKLRAFRDAGFATAIVSPGSANVLAGRLSHFGTTFNSGFKFVVSSASRNNERYPSSLIGQVELIRARLQGTPSGTNLYLPFAIRNALLAERDKNLVAVRSGQEPAYFESNTRAEIQAALGLIRELKLRGVIVQPKQLDGMIDDIRSADVGVVIGPIRVTDSEATCKDLIALGKSNVPLALGGGDAADLRMTVGCLVNGGLPRPVARRALVAQSLDRFGLPASVSRLTVGDPARFVIWDGDPLDSGVRPVRVVYSQSLVGDSSSTTAGGGD